MLWRARSVPGWLVATPERSRLFCEEAEHLLRDANQLQPQADGLLGHPLASRSFRECVPDISEVVGH